MGQRQQHPPPWLDPPPRGWRGSLGHLLPRLLLAPQPDPDSQTQRRPWFLGGTWRGSRRKPSHQRFTARAKGSKPPLPCPRPRSPPDGAGGDQLSQSAARPGSGGAGESEEARRKDIKGREKKRKDSYPPFCKADSREFIYNLGLFVLLWCFPRNHHPTLPLSHC